MTDSIDRLNASLVHFKEVHAAYRKILLSVTRSQIIVALSITLCMVIATHTGNAFVKWFNVALSIGMLYFFIEGLFLIVNIMVERRNVGRAINAVGRLIDHIDNGRI